MKEQTKIPESIQGDTQRESTYLEGFNKGYSARSQEDFFRTLPCTYEDSGIKTPSEVNAFLIGAYRGREASVGRYSLNRQAQERDSREYNPPQRDLLDFMGGMRRNPGFIPNWAWGQD